MNAEQRAAALARCEAATEGPWESVPNLFYQVRCAGWHFRNIAQVVTSSETAGRIDGRDRDAEFIAHARTDLPAALAMLAAIEADVAQLRFLYRTNQSVQSVLDTLASTLEGDDG